MSKLEERIEEIITNVNSLHDTVNRNDWAKISREGFVFELERASHKLKEIFLDLEEANREFKMLLERNSPTFEDILSELSREMTVLESNIKMEKSKKIRDTLVNQTEKLEVPELYSSMQQKLIALSLKIRHSIERAKTFLLAKQNTFVKKGSTARALIEMLEQKENELKSVKEKHFELKRKNFFGNLPEKSIAEIERELFDSEKKLSESVSEATKTLKGHFAQIQYVEGSFSQLKQEVDKIESQHEHFSRKALELIKELKQERDFAKNIALEVEHETMSIRNSYTHQLLELEKKKAEIEEKIREKYLKQINDLKRELEEKTVSNINLNKLISEQEKEITHLKKLLEKNQ